MITWKTQEAELNSSNLTPFQLEFVRRAGAARRHAERVDAAEAEVIDLAGEGILAVAEAPTLGGERAAAVYAELRGAVARAMEHTGLPGSSAGTAPPGWGRDNRSRGARDAAMREALQRFPAVAPEGYRITGILTSDWPTETRVGVAVVEPDGGQLLGDWFPSGTIALWWHDQYPALVEHMLANAVEPAAAAIDRWTVARLSGEDVGPMPPAPDPGACKALDIIIQRRRARTVWSPETGRAE